MVSYRESLIKIGVPKAKPISYVRDFHSRPRSLQSAIASMDAPMSEQWSEVSSIFRDDFWTDEVQGVAFDGSHWIFSADANQKKPDVNDKALYVFDAGGSLGDGKWTHSLRFKDVPHPLAGTKESDDHWGQLSFYEGDVYVAHFWETGAKDVASAVVFHNANGELTFSRWVELEIPTSPTDGRREKAEFQAINPWDGKLYTCFGGPGVHEFFLHDPMTGKWSGATLKLDPPVHKVQGACFSPNGHLYIATNEKLASDSNYQMIWCHSALNGHRFGGIAVLAEEADQELEGICFAELVTAAGKGSQIHAILVENRDVAPDNIWLKSYSAANPSVV